MDPPAHQRLQAFRHPVCHGQGPVTDQPDPRPGCVSQIRQGSGKALYLPEKKGTQQHGCHGQQGEGEADTQGAAEAPGQPEAPVQKGNRRFCGQGKGQAQGKGCCQRKKIPRAEPDADESNGKTKDPYISATHGKNLLHM